MIEILWHGRGGQGAFTAARLLGAACALGQGSHALAFPSFGPERRGAPMCAFTKVSDKPIGDRSAITLADYVVYLDATLLGPDFADELKPGGRVLVNSTADFDDPRVVGMDADGISTRILGRAIPNTALLARLAMCMGLPQSAVECGIRECMPSRIQDKNISLVEAVMATDAGNADLAGAMREKGGTR